MTVLLVLATFVAFAVIDWVLNRGAVEQPATAPALARPDYVEGFLVPQTVRYHPGHGWVLPERQHLVRVGVDEFAAALIGNADAIELPKPGRWIRQGQQVWNFMRGGEKTSMVSPIEGEIVEVNAEVVANPSLLRSDPYGKGWLMSVYVPDEESTFRNFVPASMVMTWIREATAKMWALQPQLAGATAPDGGRPAAEPLANLTPSEWKRVTSEFFLT